MTQTLQIPRHHCGYRGTPMTPGMAAYALRQHSCQRQRAAAAARARRAAARERLDRTPQPCLHTRSRHRHGTPACYRHDRCRCWPCSRANSAAVARRRRRQGYGQWEPFTDARPAAAHLQQLITAGLGLDRIAELSGVARSSLWNLLNGRLGRDRVRRTVTRLRSSTAARILAVTATGDTLAAERWVPAIGTSRRLQALAYLGWSHAQLAERIGITPQRVRQLQLGGTRVPKTTAEATAAVYDQLWDTPPPQETGRQRRAAELARARAKKQRWAPAMAWDDELNPIDDHAAQPDLGERVRPAKLPPADELRYLLNAGESENMIARRFRVKPTAVKKALERDRTETPALSEPAAPCPAAEEQETAA